jgi:hypothetical protein
LREGKQFNLQNSYTQEHKLAAVDYVLYTWRINAKGKEECISYRRAAKKLGITDIMIGRWVKNQSKIAQQKKGSWRSRGFGLLQEEAMEHRLLKKLDDAQAKGRQITY